MKQKRYFLTFALVVGAVLATVAVVSYFGDPGGAFGRNVHEKEMATVLLSGANVYRFDNCDERLIQENLIRNDTRRIDAIVLGSSRSMQIRTSSVFGPAAGDQVLLNHGVPSASLEDYIAILDLYLEKGNVPRTVIIGVDPWIFNTNNGLQRWRTMEDEYYDGLGRINSTMLPADRGSIDLGYSYGRYSALISRPILFSSLEKFLFGWCHATDAEEADAYIKFADGAISYPDDIRTRTTEQVDADATEYANADPIFALGGFSRIDDESRQEFESMVRYLKSRNTTVILFLPPYHPIVQDKIANDPDYSTIGTTESYLREFASTENLTAIGSYDPYRLNLMSIDFYDGIHLRREVVDSIFRAALPVNAGGVNPSAA